MEIRVLRYFLEIARAGNMSRAAETLHVSQPTLRVQDRAREIRSLQEEVPKLKTQLAETKGIFKSRERKELETKIQRTEEKISAMLEELPEILKEDG